MEETLVIPIINYMQLKTDLTGIVYLLVISRLFLTIFSNFSNTALLSSCIHVRILIQGTWPLGATCFNKVLLDS